MLIILPINMKLISVPIVYELFVWLLRAMMYENLGLNHGELLAVPPATDLASHWWREHGDSDLSNHTVFGTFWVRSTKVYKK